VLVARDQALTALRAVHAAFDLHKDPKNGRPGDSGAHATASTALEIVRQLQGMEELTIDEITLDEKQARVSIDEVPDRPGTAAAVFKEVAAAGVFVDMIVQSYSRAGKANLTFTVPVADLQKSTAIAEKVAKEFGCGAVTASKEIDKISVQGIGMRSHSGVALGLFRSLSEAGINVDLMSTSEVRVNVLVDGNAGQKAQKCLQATFAKK
jgi:aspartate kinase